MHTNSIKCIFQMEIKFLVLVQREVRGLELDIKYLQAVEIVIHLDCTLQLTIMWVIKDVLLKTFQELVDWSQFVVQLSLYLGIESVVEQEMMISSGHISLLKYLSRTNLQFRTILKRQLINIFNSVFVSTMLITSLFTIWHCFVAIRIGRQYVPWTQIMTVEQMVKNWVIRIALGNWAWHHQVLPTWHIQVSQAQFMPRPIHVAVTRLC